MLTDSQLLGWIVILFSMSILTGGIDQVTSDGLKVQHILKTIEAHSKEPPQKANRKAVITQGELTAYIAYRLSREKRPIIKNLQVTLLGENRLRGNIHFDLGGNDILKLFGSELYFDFDGELQSRDGAGKLNLTSLHLNGEAVSPRALDPVLTILAIYYGTEPGTANDWYELPKGIDRIEINQAKAVLYY